MGKRPSIPDKITTRLWVLAGGRCQYDGCNESLWRDDLRMADINGAYIAHIIDVNPQTHRYDPVLSPKLAKDISNLMLLCSKHHRLIDYEEEREHSVERLSLMKKQHEERIELLTSIQEEKKSHVILYGANIGEHSAPLNWSRAVQAMIPNRYPAEARAIELSIRNSTFEDSTSQYWMIERQNLQTIFNTLIRPRIISGNISHLSIFALAPQPLLIELGRLISDIHSAEVYQLHREPPDWRWQENPDGFEYLVNEPNDISNTVVLNLSLSATIDNTRISAALPEKDLTIWHITIPTPNNDYLKSREQLSMFRQTFRQILDKIKSVSYNGFL